MNERRDLLQQQRELNADRRSERVVFLLGVLSLIPVAAIIVLRVVIFV
jgi:hypothetical protein